jgi:hypothetical protein
MRVGTNPNKINDTITSDHLHQVIIPLYIPNQEGYFKDVFEIFKLCLESLFKTSHSKTFFTIVNNGSCKEVKEFIDRLLLENRVHEVIHTTNIGKLNAVYKGLIGNNIELVTIADADVLFLNNWQSETVKIFDKVQKAGVVGIVPQFNMFRSNTENVIYSNLFNSKLKFLPVINPEAMLNFYDSIGWKRDYNEDYLKYILGLDISNDFKVVLGSGHFVATYKRAMFESIQLFASYKMGGKSLNYLDTKPLQKDFWRLTTYDNYAYHMGNVIEPWMNEIVSGLNQNEIEEHRYSFFVNKSLSSKWVLFRNKVFKKLVLNKTVIPFLYKKWGLPKDSIKKF